MLYISITAPNLFISMFQNIVSLGLTQQFIYSIKTKCKVKIIFNNAKQKIPILEN